MPLSWQIDHPIEVIDFCSIRCVVTEENVIWHSIARNLRRTSIGILHYEFKFFFVQFKFPNYKIKVYPNNGKKSFMKLLFVCELMWYDIHWVTFPDIFSTKDIKKVASYIFINYVIIKKNIINHVILGQRLTLPPLFVSFFFLICHLK